MKTNIITITLLSVAALALNACSTTQGLARKSSDHKQTRTGPGLCRVTVRNGCPPDWGVVLIAGAVKFTYEDGSTFQDGPRQLNVASGGETSFSNNDPQKCVKAEVTAVTARDAQGDHVLQGNGYPEPSSGCLTGITQTVGPAATAKGTKHKFTIRNHP